MNYTVAIVGRPNVGKSTLFNRLLRKKIALIDDQPGVTRDLREAKLKLIDTDLTIIDTAGLESAPEKSLAYRMSRLSLSAIKSSDICLFVIDSRAGVTAEDETFAEIVRKTSKFVMLVVNKVEGKTAEHGIYESFSLGLGEPISISAEHGVGINELRQKVEENLKFIEDHNSDSSNENEICQDDWKLSEITKYAETQLSSDYSKEIQMSIIGRPNAGKSTLINKIMGSQRLLTGPEAGITRDAISSSVNWHGQDFRIFDTAGMRKKAKINDKLEKIAVADGIKAIKFSEIVVLLLDINSPFDSQDLKIADLAEREGRCLVVAVNKWDLEKTKNQKLVKLSDDLKNLLPQLSGVPLVPISGLSGFGLQRLFEKILQVYKVWNIRISTSKLNDWLSYKLSMHPPPSKSGKRIKMRYITQYTSRPPSFVIFTSLPKRVPESYKRYLVNGLREDFGISGVPIRLILKAGANPYDANARKRKLKS